MKRKVMVWAAGFAGVLVTCFGLGCGSSEGGLGGSGGSGSSTSTTGSITTGSDTGSATTGSTTTGSDTGSTALPPGACRDDSACAPAGAGGSPAHFCSAGDVCVDGVGPGCFGDGSLKVPCAQDADCAGALFSGPLVCRKCGGSAGFCDAPCSDTNACPPGATCDPTGHCVPKACAASGDCPPNLVCSPTESVCVRKACSADADCSGYCIAGHCTESLGKCSDCT